MQSQAVSTSNNLGQAKDLKDSRAYKLYASAKANERANNYLLAQTQYEEALKIAKEQSITSDPKFVAMIDGALNGLKRRMHAIQQGQH